MMNNNKVKSESKEESETCETDNTEKETDNDSLVNILIDFVKDELLKSNIRYEIVKPILIYILYYLIPFIILLMLLNFITTIIAVYIVFRYLL
jgi:hypothetical protein